MSHWKCWLQRKLLSWRAEAWWRCYYVLLERKSVPQFTSISTSWKAFL